MGLVIDNFAGGGGASTGIEAALGRAVDIAINHDEEAIRMHEVNHPGTVHIRNNIWQIDPLDATGGRPVDLAWFSPDCKHFSKAKGGKPREKSIRDLAWVVVHWVKRLQEAAKRAGDPDWRKIIKLICIENVEEFQTWGPLCDEGRPIKERAGETFREWCGELRKRGGKIEFKELRACDYGAPTIRKRFFMVVRFDGEPIVWPMPTHGKPGSPEVLAGKRKPWRTAAEIIDWSIPCPSIFERQKPLAEKTLRRIAHGIMKFVVNNPKPFIVPAAIVGCGGRRGQSGPIGMDQPYPTTTAKADACLVRAAIAPFSTYAQQGGRNRSAENPLHTVCANAKDQNCVAVAKLMAAHIEQANGGPNNEALAGRAADAPLSTATASGSQQRIVTSNLVKLRGTTAAHIEASAKGAGEPLGTVSAKGNHMAEVRAFLIKYYGNEQDGHGLGSPIGTVTVQDRFGLVTVTIAGEEYVIVDIGMRMLTPRELFAAQGFPADYIIDRDAQGRPVTKTAQVARCGNSVCPPIAEALVRANMAHEIQTQEVQAA